MTEKDIKFKGVKTDAAAAAFLPAGSSTAAAVFAPVHCPGPQASGPPMPWSPRPTFPGVIPRPPGGRPTPAAADADAMQKAGQRLVRHASTGFSAHHDEAVKIMAAKAGRVDRRGTTDFAKGTTIFHAPSRPSTAFRGPSR